jgi:hypothetical protein
MPSRRRDPLKPHMCRYTHNQRKEDIVNCLLDLEGLEHVELFRGSEGGIPTGVYGEFIFRIHSSRWDLVVSELNQRCLGTNAKDGTLHDNLVSCFRYFGIVPESIGGKRYKRWTKPMNGNWTYSEEEKLKAKNNYARQREAIRIRKMQDHGEKKTTEACSVPNTTENKEPSPLQLPELIFPAKEQDNQVFQANCVQLPPISFYMRQCL